MCEGEREKERERGSMCSKRKENDQERFMDDPDQLIKVVWLPNCFE